MLRASLIHGVNSIVSGLSNSLTVLSWFSLLGELAQVAGLITKTKTRTEMYWINMDKSKMSIEFQDDKTIFKLSTRVPLPFLNFGPLVVYYCNCLANVVYS